MKLRSVTVVSVVSVVTATVIALGSPVEAKGPSALMVTGVGVDRPIILEDDSAVWPKIVNESAFFDAALSSSDIFSGAGFAKTTSLASSNPTSADLGPHVRLTWTVYWDRAHNLIQDLYPDAPGGPLLYTPSGQALYDMETSGGWYPAPSGFVDALESAGVPSAEALRRARAALYTSLWLRPGGSGLIARW